MTRYGIDAATALRIVQDGVVVDSRHQLVAPAALRSEVMAQIYRDTRSGEKQPVPVRDLLERLTTMRVRLLNDRVSRRRAWEIAESLGWEDTRPAEYIAVADLQADVLIASDDRIARGAAGIIEVASYAQLVRGGLR